MTQRSDAETYEGRVLGVMQEHHKRTSREYGSRAGADKPDLAEVAKRFDRDYWDGERKFGYGGYEDDGRWEKIASKLADIYRLKPGDSVLDIGCGKGFLLAHLLKATPGLKVCGVDISKYAICHSTPVVSSYLVNSTAMAADLAPGAFDLVVSINTLHNLRVDELFLTLGKINQLSRGRSYICVESYRNEVEKWNLMRWQLTCESFYTPEEWKWIFRHTGYQGDFEFIFFE
ncbi:MAG: class I SAM-dependent methyltransferase [Bdellovibrionota bacterium]